MESESCDVLKKEFRVYKKIERKKDGELTSIKIQIGIAYQLYDEQIPKEKTNTQK